MWSSDLAIQVHQLGKRYKVGGGPGWNPMGMRELLEQVLRTPLSFMCNNLNESDRSLRSKQVPAHDKWALKDVSFDVKFGEVLGLIGHNGAGKSVLLKILSRITKPTEGQARIRGRVGSMLEAGAGFHPELTGRENIFLSGAILGMKRMEIVRQFDAIVDFSGIEEYLDTPIKRYSTGMHLRLAFAVAAHLEFEIMLIDEVLAVGDKDFRQKCVEKMRSVVATTGRTVIFVSHDMDIVKKLCDRALLLQAGHIIMYDSADRVVIDYLQEHGTSNFSNVPENLDRMAHSMG